MKTTPVTNGRLNLEHPMIDYDDLNNSISRFVVARGPGDSGFRVSPGYEISKRVFDTTVALVFVIALLPLFALIAALVKLTSPGPVLFKQERLGRGGKPFRCYKFRTMVIDAEERLQQDLELRRQFEVSFKLRRDPRITRIGNFLRVTSLDELPQFFNVLRSEMSIIGPRPIVPPELSKYGAYGEKLLTVKPGLGGLWQAMGRSGTTYDRRIELDMVYIDNCSLMLDLWLLLITAWCVIRTRGAC